MLRAQINYNMHCLLLCSQPLHNKQVYFKDRPAEKEENYEQVCGFAFSTQFIQLSLSPNKYSL